MGFSEGGGREMVSMWKFYRDWKKAEKKRKGMEFRGKTNMELPGIFFFIHHSYFYEKGHLILLGVGWV